MNTSVQFNSDIFKPFLSDEAQVNPECFGAELAWWLTKELATRSFETSYPNYEDWGWFIEYLIDDNEFWLCCGNIQGTANEWQIYLEPKAKGFFGRKVPKVELAKSLLAAIDSLLIETEDISNIRWSTQSA